jgi:hypothetical protein
LPLSAPGWGITFEPLSDRQAFCRHDRYRLAQDTARQELQLLVGRWWIADTDNVRKMFAVTTINYPNPYAVWS